MTSTKNLIQQYRIKNPFLYVSCSLSGKFFILFFMSNYHPAPKLGWTNMKRCPGNLGLCAWIYFSKLMLTAYWGQILPPSSGSYNQPWIFSHSIICQTDYVSNLRYTHRKYLTKQKIHARVKKYTSKIHSQFCSDP